MCLPVGTQIPNRFWERFKFRKLCILVRAGMRSFCSNTITGEKMLEFNCLTTDLMMRSDNGCSPNDTSEHCNPNECYPSDFDCHPAADSWCRPEMGGDCAP